MERSHFWAVVSLRLLPFSRTECNKIGIMSIRHVGFGLRQHRGRPFPGRLSPAQGQCWEIPPFPFSFLKTVGKRKTYFPFFNRLNDSKVQKLVFIKVNSSILENYKAETPDGSWYDVANNGNVEVGVEDLPDEHDGASNDGVIDLDSESESVAEGSDMSILE